jgi:hypothetical protein
VPKMKLTKASIDRVAKPGLTKSDALYWDTECRGFGLRVTPSGLAKFVSQGRVLENGRDFTVLRDRSGLIRWAMRQERRLRRAKEEEQ